MTKSFRHVGVLMMVAIVALGALGAAYTLWYEDLELHADVQTGTFDVDWSCEDGEHGHPTGEAHEECDNAAMPVASLNLGAGPFQTALQLAGGPSAPQADIDRFADKLPECDVAIGTSDPNDPGDAANDAASNNIMQLTLSNMYPYAGCEFWIDIHNAGTVPAHFTLTSIGTAGGPTASPLKSPQAPIDWTIVVTNPAGDPDRPACLATLGAFAGQGELPPIQLHEDEEIVCHFILYLDQSAAEAYTYLFWATLTAHQWNENIN